MNKSPSDSGEGVFLVWFCSCQFFFLSLVSFPPMCVFKSPVRLRITFFPTLAFEPSAYKSRQQWIYIDGTGCNYRFLYISR